MEHTELLVASLEQAGDAIIVIDREGAVRAWNLHAEALFGHTAEQMMGQQLDAMIPERLREAHDSAFTAAMERGRLASDGKARRTKAVRPDGSAVFVEMTFAVVTDAHGDAVGSVAVAREYVRESR